MTTTTLRGGRVVPVQVAHSLAPSWGVSCPYCGSRNGPVPDIGWCYACWGSYTVPPDALSIAQVNTRGMMRLLMAARGKGPR